MAEDIHHPLTSQKINLIPPFVETYSKKLIDEGILEEREIHRFIEEKIKYYESEHEKA